MHKIKQSAKSVDVKEKASKKNGKIIISVEDEEIGIDDLEKEVYSKNSIVPVKQKNLVSKALD